MTKNWNEIKDTAKIHLDDDMQIAYEKGYSDASNEILTEAIGAITQRHVVSSEHLRAGLETAMAILKQLRGDSDLRVPRVSDDGTPFIGDAL